MGDAPPSESNLEQLHKALDDIKEWLMDEDRAAVVHGLRAGAGAASLRRAESAAGAPFPLELRALYERHDGQTDREADPFFGDLVFADLDYALGLRGGMLYAYFGVRAGGRIEPGDIYCDPQTPLLPEELNDRWFPFANMGGDFLAIHLVTGRVFRAMKDLPALRLVGASLTAFLCEYADRLWNGNYDTDDAGHIVAF